MRHFEMHSIRKLPFSISVLLVTLSKINERIGVESIDRKCPYVTTSRAAITPSNQLK